MPGLTVDGVQLVYEERGGGEPLVLIPKQYPASAVTLTNAASGDSSITT